MTEQKENEKLLWEAYWSNPTNSNMSALIVHYKPYMLSVIKKTCKVLPNWIDRDDIFQETSLALALTIPKYTRKSAENANFMTYSNRRIHGAIVDYLRAYGPKRRRTEIHCAEITHVVTNDNGHVDDFFASIEDAQDETRTQKINEAMDISGFSRLLPSVLQQYIFRLYFIEYMPMRLIATLIKLSESRVSQLIQNSVRIIKERQVCH